jgi:hypothetical protein
MAASDKKRLVVLEGIGHHGIDLHFAVAHESAPPRLLDHLSLRLLDHLSLRLLLFFLPLPSD